MCPLECVVVCHAAWTALQAPVRVTDESGDSDSEDSEEDSEEGAEQQPPRGSPQKAIRPPYFLYLPRPPQGFDVPQLL